MTSRARVLLIGAGGLGCAVGLSLARARLPWDLTIVDPDRIEASNLQRQVLYRPSQVGVPKAVAAVDTLRLEAAAHGSELRAEAIVGRVTAGDAIAQARAHDLVIEGTDRGETKFLIADACALAGTPVVHAGVVRWAGWALASDARHGPCLRCVFEDLPTGAPLASCAEDGVMGPAVGTLGALQASLAASLWLGAEGASGVLIRHDARAGTLRSIRVGPRAHCALCSADATILDLRPERYLAPGCAA